MSIRGLVSELPTNKEVLYSGTLGRLSLPIPVGASTSAVIEVFTLPIIYQTWFPAGATERGSSCQTRLAPGSAMGPGTLVSPVTLPSISLSI